MLLLDRLIGQHYRHPRGLFGRLAGRRMAQQHAAENSWTLALLEPQPDDLILEIGFGPGIAIEALARVVTRGHIVGIDISGTMVAEARKRNAGAIKDGRVELRQASAGHLPLPAEYFDKALGIHTLYFWPQPLDALRELHRVLKPAGRLILTILPREEWRTADGRPDPGTENCVPYTGGEVMALMRAAGFRRTEIRGGADPAHPSNFSVIGVK